MVFHEILSILSKELPELLVPIHNKMKQLFQDKPIWLKSSLFKNFAKEDSYKAKRVLPLVAYFNLAGPWGRTWIRNNYDPKLTNDAKQ